MSNLGTPQQATVRSSRRVPALHIIIAVVIALLLLFLWMHFILAMQIEATGRLIQEEMVVLERLERQNAALGRKIAEGSSQNLLTRRAEEMGYELRAPHYLLLSRPLFDPDNGTLEETSRRAVTSGDSETWPSHDMPFLDAIAASFSTP